MDAQETPDPLIFSEHYPLVCICKWIARLGVTGWFLQDIHPRCQLHGKKEEA